MGGQRTNNIEREAAAVGVKLAARFIAALSGGTHTYLGESDRWLGDVFKNTLLADGDRPVQAPRRVRNALFGVALIACLALDEVERLGGDRHEILATADQLAENWAPEAAAWPF